MADTSQQARESIRVTLVGALLDLVLGVLKIVVGLFANSLALVSDGIHSLSDLLTDAFVLVIARISHQQPDRTHPYGHGRFETLGTAVISIALFMVAGGICYDSIRRLNEMESLPLPGWLALLVAFLSIAGKEWIYRYTRRVARRINSPMLLANAWHSRTDALSSVVVLLGLVAARFGYPWMDLVAAIIVAMLIASIAWKLISDSLKELVDSALPEKELKRIRKAVMACNGIRGVHELRSRQHGGRVLLDVHVQVDSRISVSEGHYLGDQVSEALHTQFPEIADVLVHIDPEHLPAPVDMTLPGRNEVERQLLDCWHEVLQPEQLRRLTLHYLGDNIELEIFIDNSIYNNELKEKLKALSRNLPWRGPMRVYGSP